MRATAERVQPPALEPEPSPKPPRSQAFARSVAGPALIVALTLFALRAFVFESLLTNQHPDILSFILPRLAFLGRSLADGHLPLWNPFHFAGAPYAADPQSGWLYLSPMLLFSTLSPGTAMRAFIVWNPLLAGLGMYTFLRLERLSRTAATAGGLSIALALAASTIAISLPFAGAIAWTTVVLVGAAGYVRTRRLSRRAMWLALAAFGWGQVASAHMSHGLAMCTALTAGYLIAHAVWDARADDRSGWRAAGSVVVFLAVLPLANLAILLPRLDYIARSSLGGGYEGLADPLGQGRLAERPIMTNGVWGGWPFALGTAPGAYVGAILLLCVPAALRTKRHRALLWGFGVVGLLAYLATLNALVTAEWFRSFVLQLPFGDVYLHNPGRLRYLAYVVIPPIGAIGLQTLIDRPLPWRRALRWLLAGVALWLVVPVLVGADPVRFLLLVIGVVIGVPVLLALSERRRWAVVVVPLVLAVELLGSAVYSQVYDGGTIYLGLEAPDRSNLLPGPLRAPEVRTQEFTDPGELGRFLAQRPERYLTWVRPAAYYVKGYLWTQESADWPSMVNERGTLFGARDVLGYNPVQPAGYWSYVRATNQLYTFYNASVINEPTIEDLHMLGVRYLIVAEGQSPSVSGRLVRSADGYDLYEVVGWQPLVSVVADVDVVDGPARSLRAVLTDGFDPRTRAVVEQDPGFASTSFGADPAGFATVREHTPEDVRLVVSADHDALVVVRTNWDPGWTATVDGRPVPVLRTDHFLMGIPVAAGEHDVRLTYSDPAIGRGLAASAIVWIALLGAATLGAIAERRRSREGISVDTDLAGTSTSTPRAPEP
ncbi:MAG: YfhO family protein [Actinomycetota bacterium]